VLAAGHDARCAALVYLLQVFADHLQQFGVGEEVVFGLIWPLLGWQLCEMGSHFVGIAVRLRS
jgi:hypothetical protein